MESLEVAELAASLANGKKAENVVIMDMSRVSGICDFFVLCGATSAIRARTIAEAIKDGMRERGVRPLHSEGLKEGRWILMDLGGVIVHVFQDETRRYYNLEELWGDAPRRPFTKDTVE